MLRVSLPIKVLMEEYVYMGDGGDYRDDTVEQRIGYSRRCWVFGHCVIASSCSNLTNMLLLLNAVSE